MVLEPCSLGAYVNSTNDLEAGQEMLGGEGEGGEGVGG